MRWPGRDTGAERPPTTGSEAPDLTPDFYAQLRQVAARYLRGERGDHLLQPTALVHEAWLRVRRLSRMDIRNRTHFLALMSRTMRRILVEHARAQRALKRGGGRDHIRVEDAVGLSTEGSTDLLELDAALETLAALDERATRIVELRFFAGLTEVEIAAHMGMSERWVRKQWAFARAWLQRELSMADAPVPRGQSSGKSRPKGSGGR